MVVSSPSSLFGRAGNNASIDRIPPISSRGAPPISLTNALLREGGMLIRPARDVSYRTEERLAGSGSRYPRRTGWELTDPLQAAEVQAARSASCYGRGPRSPS